MISVDGRWKGRKFKVILPPPTSTFAQGCSSATLDSQPQVHLTIFPVLGHLLTELTEVTGSSWGLERLLAHPGL